MTNLKQHNLISFFWGKAIYDDFSQIQIFSESIFGPTLPLESQFYQVLVSVNQECIFGVLLI